jgi:tetratricopeptide (TPR) repeat protein
LKGRFHFQNFTGDGYLTGIKYYDKAIEISPGYAKAHAGRASCYLNLWHFALLPPERSVQQMHDSTFKALELDDGIAESHYAVARYKLWHDFDLKGAEKEFLNTFSYNPNIPEAIAHYGFVSNFLRHPEKAMGLVRRSKELDPFAPMAGLDLIANLWVAGEFDTQLEEARKILEIHPQFWGAHWYIAYFHWENKEYDKAVNRLKKAMETFYGQVTLSLLGCLYGVMGETEKALDTLTKLEKLSESTHVGSFNYALIYAGMGDMDKTFQYLEVAGQERTGLLIFLDYFARGMIPSLNQDQRFKPYLKKVGIPICE